MLSKFYGIVVGMLFIRPYVSHFHAIYNDWELVVGIAPLQILQGDAPRRVRCLVLEWALRHQQELLEAWNRLSTDQKPSSIEPLH